jgi:serine/threonine-protein kinase
MRRHRGGVAITALLALGMVASLAVALWQARAAQLAAAEARSEAARAHTLRNFMIEAFAQAAPSTPGAMDATVVDVVERAVMNARADQSANPSARVDLLIRLALVLDARDRAARSAELLAQAQALAQQALSPNDALHDELDLAMARNAILRYDFDVADARIHALRSRMPDHASPTHVLALIESATLATYRGRMQQAQTDAASAAAMARALNDDALLHDALRAQGSALIHAGDVTASIAAFEEALRLQRTRYADAHVDVATDQDALASAYQRAGDLVRAESYARAAVETDTRAMPGDHIHLAYHSVTLASIQIERRAFDQALPVLTRVIAIQTRQGARQSNLASNYESLSIARGGLGDWPGALAAVHHALSLLTDENDPSKRNRARIQSLYGWALAQNGERAAGLAQLDLALRMQRALPKPAPEQVAIALERVLRIALDHDDLTRAAQVLPQYLDAARALSGKPNWPGRAEAARVEYLLARGDTGGAQAALARASQQQQRSTRVDAEIRALIPILRLIAARRSALNEAVVSDLADAARRALAELPYPPQRLIRLAAAAGLAP